MALTTSQLQLIRSLLPSAAETDYGWTDDRITEIMEANGFATPAQVVRFFWLERVNETAEYLDTGKPLTQIHNQAKAMLDYWDKVLLGNPAGIDPVKPKNRISFGSIERPWVR